MKQLTKFESRVDFSMESTPFREYYDAYENIVYYSSLGRQDQRYQYRPTLIACLKICIGTLNETENRRLMQREVFSRLRSDFSGASDTLSALVEEDEECVSLLRLTNTTDIRDLRKKYRQACMKYHPDRGGDEEKLKIINSHYPAFFQILTEASAEVDSRSENFIEWVKIETVADFCCFLNVKLFQLLLEEDDIKGAKRQLRVIELNGSFDTNAYKASRFKDYDTYVDNPLHRVFYDGLIKLAGRLSALGEREQVSNLLNGHIRDMEYRLRYLSRHWLSSNRDALDRKARGEKKEIIVIKRRRQAQNLYEQGLIDLARYNKAIMRLEANESEELKSKEIFARRICDTSFVRLSDFDRYSYDGKSEQTVPYPPAWEATFDELDPKQLNEYIMTYYHSPTYELVSKYLEVRLCSAILDLHKVHHTEFLEALREEFVFFNEVLSGQKWLTNSMVTYVEHLIGLDHDVRKKYIGSEKDTKRLFRMCGPAKYLEIALE